MTTDAASKAALKKWEEKFAKTFGADTLQHSSTVSKYEVIPTGSIVLDYKLGVGGLVEGRLVEMWGPDGVGKTTLSLLMVAEAQRKHPKKKAAFIDVEQKFDKAWAVAHGVNLANLYLYTPESAEDVADAVKEMCRSGFFSIIVLDSIGAMIPEAEKEKDADEAVMAAQAKIITRMVKINAVEARKTGTAFVMLNQVRANLAYGADTTTGGGFALKHSTTMKFKIRRTSTAPYKVKINGEDRIVGHEVAITIERNNVAPAYRTAIVSLINVPTEKYGPIGIDRADEATTVGLDTNVIEQSGAWYNVPLTGERVNGRPALVAALRKAPEVVEYVRTAALDTVAHEVKEEETVEEEAGGFRKGAGALAEANGG